MRKRKGRDRKVGDRHPSGKLRQPGKKALEDAAKAVVIDARMRIHNLTEEQAKREEASVVLGRMFFHKEISREQYDAGWRYVEIVEDYRRAILARGVPSAGDLDRSRGFDGSDGTDPAYVAKCKRDISIYKHVRRELLSAPDPFAQSVLDAVAIEGRDMPTFIGTLRIALNAVSHAISGAKAA